MLKTDLALLQEANDAERAYTTEYYGRVRVAHCELKADAAETGITLFTLPAGRIRILQPAYIKSNLATAATTIKIGYAAYTKTDGTAVVADDDAILAAVATNTAKTAVLPVVLESKDGVTITATASANLAVNDTLSVELLFVVD